MKQLIKLLKCLFIFYPLFLATGCASGYLKQTPYSDNMLVGKDTATVVIMREDQFQGSLITMEVGIDTDIVANLGVGEYVEFKVPAGIHYVSSGDITSETPGAYNEVIKIDAKKDLTYFVKFSMNISISDFKFLYLLDPVEGLNELNSGDYEKIN